MHKTDTFFAAPTSASLVAVRHPIVLPRRRWIAAAGSLLLSGPAALGNSGGATVAVAVAANVQTAFEALLAAFHSQTAALAKAERWPRLMPIYGSSSNLARQIQQGLPVALFLSADEALPQKLFDAGLSQGPSVVYGVGRLALVSAPGSRLVLDASLSGLRAALPGIGKFAIANPDLAPYGLAARQALQKLGLWEALVPRLVLGENIAQTAQFVSSGAADAGLTAYSLVAGAAAGAAMQPAHPSATTTVTTTAPRFAAAVKVAADLHAPLRQRMVLLKNPPPQAAQLFAFLQTAAAQEVLKRFGFEVA
jgi:molybdate transport system substrate-binding protein